MNDHKRTALRFQIRGLALFGDRENGRDSERGTFTVNGNEFMSMEPVSREDSAEINRAMTALRKELGK